MNYKPDFYHQLVILIFICSPSFALASSEESLNVAIFGPVFLILAVVGIGLWFLMTLRRTKRPTFENLPADREHIHVPPDDESISSNSYEPITSAVTTDQLELVRKGFLLLESHLEQLKMNVNDLKPLKDKVYQLELRNSDVFLENRINELLDKKVADIVKAEVSRSFQAEIIRTVNKTIKDTTQAKITRAVNLTIKELKNTLEAEISRAVNDRLEDIKAEITNAAETLLSEPVRAVSTDTEIDEVPTVPLYSADNESIRQIKAALLEISVVDETELNRIETTVDACTFVIKVIQNALKQPITDYQRLNEALTNVTDDKLSLIIPTIGEDIRPTEHQVVHQQAVTKGKINAVVALVRPGVKCDNIIQHKAEVIQSI